MTTQSNATIPSTGTIAAPNPWPPPVMPPSTPTSSASAAWTLGTISTIWCAVALISVLSPDMVSGSEQQHMPIAAFGSWLWGLSASLAAFASMARLRHRSEHRLMVSFAFSTMGIWSIATVASVSTPSMVTGSDPTTIPLAALIAPVVAMIATALAAIVVNSSAPSPTARIGARIPRRL